MVAGNYSNVATYGTDDFDDIIMDGLGTAGVEVITYIAIIVLIFLFGWFKLKAKKLQ